VILRSTIDQHLGTHPATGMQVYELVEVVTEGEDADETWLADLHRARVALAELSAADRKYAQWWLDDHCSEIDAADEAHWIRRAIEESRNRGHDVRHHDTQERP
jgi:hypothetical protein